MLEKRRRITTYSERVASGPQQSPRRLGSHRRHPSRHPDGGMPRGRPGISTGPRSIERGRQRRQAAPIIERRTSTGPRSVERGMGVHLEHGNERSRSSTGPRSIERGVDPTIRLHLRPTVASTGPRSIERGVGTIGPLVGWRTLVLQRGRAQLSAESPQGQQVRAAWQSFNGAALN